MTGRPAPSADPSADPRPDESVLCIVEAESEELVSEAYMRAGLSFERISIVVTEEASVPTRRGSTGAAS